MSGDRSLLNHGAPTAPRAVGNKKEMVGPTVPHLEGGSPPSRARGAKYSALGSAFERSAPFGRKDKLGPLRGKKVVRPSPRKREWWGQPFPTRSVGSLVLARGGNHARRARNFFSLRGITLPIRGEPPLSSGFGKTIPQAAWRRPAPFTQGGLYGAALPQRKKRPFGRFSVKKREAHSRARRARITAPAAA